MAEEASRIRGEAKAELQKLREILGQKEKEIEDSINRIEERKKRHLQNEMEKAQTSLEKIPNAISTVQSALDEKDAQKFFEFYEVRISLSLGSALLT